MINDIKVAVKVGAEREPDAVILPADDTWVHAAPDPTHPDAGG